MNKPLFLSLIIASIFVYISQASVIGIDFGSEYYKISLIAPGKTFLIMENTFSKRKTHTSVSFINDERLFESDAAGKKSRNPANTFTFFKKFVIALGEDKRTLEISNKFYEDYLSEINSRQTFDFKIPSFAHKSEDEEYFQVNTEEVLAMIFMHAKNLTEKQFGLTVSDCVFTIPANWSLSQRNMLYTAALIADLNPFAFIHENTAVALNYGFERQDLNKTHKVLFYNLGSSNLKVNLVDFYALNISNKSVEHITVLAEEETDLVSGREFDFVLANHVVELFDNLPQNKGKESILKNRPVFRRILNEVSKFKEILSANKEAYLFIEGLYNDIDFNALIDRSTFEAKSSSLLEELIKPIESILKKTNTTIDELDAIELFGGAVRIPMVQTKLSEFFKGKEIGQHLNGDEAAAMGAAFQAANYSHIYKVRNIILKDGYNFGINLKISDSESGEIINERNLFEVRENFGAKRKIEFEKLNDLSLTLSKVDNNGNEETFKIIQVFNTSNVLESGNYTNVTNLSLVLDFTLCTIKGIDLKAYLKFEERKFVESEYYDFIIDDTLEFPEEENNNNTNTTNEINEGDNSTNSNNSNNKTNKTEKSKEKKLIKEIKEQIKKNELKLPISIVIPYPLSLSLDEMKTSYEKLRILNEKEEIKRRTAKSRNDLEAFLYYSDELNQNEIFNLVSNSSQREKMDLLVSENKEWIESDEGYSSNYSIYEIRLEDLKNSTYSILYRMEEYKYRDQAINDTRRIMGEFEKTVVDLNATHPWIPFKTRLSTLGLLFKAKGWFEKNVELQANMSLTEDPVIRAYELSDVLDKLQKNVTSLKNMKPSPDYYEKMMKDYMKNNPPKKNNSSNATDNETTPNETTKDVNVEDVIDLDSKEQNTDTHQPKKKEENEKLSEEPELEKIDL